jgi:hypothetical protein
MCANASDADIRAAIVGAGRVADRHARSIDDDPRATVTAVCDTVTVVCETDRERAVTVANPRNATVYTDYGNLLDAETIDVCYPLTPPFVRSVPAVVAAECGIDLFIEKPRSGRTTPTRPGRSHSPSPRPRQCAATERLCRPTRATDRIESVAVARVTGIFPLPVSSLSRASVAESRAVRRLPHLMHGVGVDAFPNRPGRVTLRGRCHAAGPTSVVGSVPVEERGPVGVNAAKCIVAGRDPVAGIERR